MPNYFRAQYQEKLRTPEQAIQVIESGDWVDYGMFNGKPVACDRALAARKGELSDIKVMTAMTVPPLPEVVTTDPRGEVFTYTDLHFSLVSRIMQKQFDGVYYSPLCYGEAEQYCCDALTDPDNVGGQRRKAFIIQVSPVDKYGYFNWGIHNSASYAQAKCAQKVIVEVNRRIPVGLGGSDEKIHISEVDYIVEGDDPILFELPAPLPSEVDRQIAFNIIPHLRNGCCIQLGIGSLPNLLGKMIADTDLKDLGGHTEMLVDAYRILWESGQMNGSQKSFDKGKISYTFALGSKDLYKWIDHNPALASCNVGNLLAPTKLAHMDNLISINQALQVDIYSQVNAETSGHNQISGNGGLTDFVLGGYWSKGGRSIICLPSTHTTKDGTLISNIVPAFAPGTTTTIPRQLVNIIATEFGWISLKGTSTWERAEKLVSITHPDFRDDLIKAATKSKIWRRTNKIS